MVATSPQSPMAGELELEEEKVNFSDVKEFPLAFWLLTLSCIVVYGCVLPFNNIASSFIVERFICNGECCKSCNPNCASSSSLLPPSVLLSGRLLTPPCSLLALQARPAATPSPSATR